MSFMNGVLADDVQDLAKEVPCRENEETRANRAASTRGEKGKLRREDVMHREKGGVTEEKSIGPKIP